MRSSRVHQLLAFCRRPDPHEEVEHDWATMGRMGLCCDCPCHHSVESKQSLENARIDGGGGV